MSSSTVSPGVPCSTAAIKAVRLTLPLRLACCSSLSCARAAFCFAPNWRGGRVERAKAVADLVRETRALSFALKFTLLAAAGLAASGRVSDGPTSAPMLVRNNSVMAA